VTPVKQPSIPFWLPVLWIGATLALLPGMPLVTLAGYHAICLLGTERSDFRAGRMPIVALLGMGAACAVLPLLLHQRPAHLLPMAGAQTFLAHWPGGFPSYVAYTLTVNSVCEEGFWRGALARRHADWKDWQHGSAFGLHHFVGNGLVFGWASALPAFLYTAAAGWTGMKVSRRCGGLGLVILAHSALNALSFAWLATRL
jgi:membrane protease YdiL (CAAX protease family)